MLLHFLEQRLTQPQTAEESGVKNTSLSAAKREKNDEFYTQLTDVEKELQHYKNHFKGKVVFCNCDDPAWSSFWKYFTLNFSHLGLAKVIATHYAQGNSSYKREYIGGDDLEGVKTPLSEDGDFRSEECVELLREADIVVTNPPFSLFREYVAQLMEHQKKFLIIGNNNAITYKEIFRLLRDNQVWLGHSANKTMEFQLSPDYAKWDRQDEKGNKFGKVPAISWFTNLPHAKRAEELLLFKTRAGNEAAYPKYENYNAIEVSKVVDIPVDYMGVMGVPITFLDKYNPNQFEIVWLAAGNTRASAPKEILDELQYVKHKEDRGGCPVVSGKRTYGRILIRRKIDAKK